MSAKLSPKPRLRVERTHSSLRIHISARRRPKSIFTFSWRLLYLLLLGVLLGPYSGPMIVRMLAYYLPEGYGMWAFLVDNPVLVALLLLAVVLWVLLVLHIAYSLLWETVGQETIEIGGESLHIRRNVLCVSQLRQFPISHIAEVRATAYSRRFRIRVGTIVGEPPAWVVVFDCNTETVKLRSKLSEVEAEQIVAEIEKDILSAT